MLGVKTESRVAVWTVLVNRLFYSINWFSVPPIFYLIAADLHSQVSGLGLISSAFLVGIGLFQVPGAVLSSRYGARTVCLAGMLLLSVSALLCALASEIWVIAVLRFFSGMGMALFFPPSIALMTDNSPPGRTGLVLGLNNGVASLGGGIGLFAWAIIGDSFGWRLAMALVGALGLASSAFLLLLVRRDAPSMAIKFTLADVRRVLADRWLLLVGGVLLAYNVGNTLVATFAEVYLHDGLGLSAALSGGFGSLVVLSGLFTAPLAGHFHDRVSRVRLVLVAAGLAIAGGVALASVATPAAVVAAAVTVGLASGVGYTFGFGTAWNSARGVRGENAVAMSWVNSIQLLFGFWAPYVFSYVVVGYGYGLAWLTGGLYTAVFVVPLALARKVPRP